MTPSTRGATRQPRSADAAGQRRGRSVWQYPSRAQADGDAIAFIVVREIFKHLEKIADALEDVANPIDGIVIDYA